MKKKKPTLSGGREHLIIDKITQQMKKRCVPFFYEQQFFTCTNSPD